MKSNHNPKKDTAQQKSADEVRQSVRESYSKVAEGKSGTDCCAPNSTASENACCGSDDFDVSTIYSTRLGYSEEEVKSVPQGADMGLGCGNPRAIAALKPGETVLDLGSGGGFDCFLAAREVGNSGHVIGVDMTPSMVSKARANADKIHSTQVEFRLGEIEHLPVADASVDVIISNCVINLSPDKQQVFKEAMRVLKPEGRLAISDVVASAQLPDEVKHDLALHSACVAGATVISELKDMMKAAGFINIAIIPKDESREFIKDWAQGRKIDDYVVSAYIEAVKPKSNCCAPNSSGLY
jgi:arsenite methyltransferase